MESRFIPRAMNRIGAVSNLALRLIAYVFLRWIPGHPFPPIIFTLLLIYVTIFVSLLTRTTKHDRTWSSFIQCCFTGLPSKSGTLPNSLICSINIILVFFVADVVYRGPLFYPSHDVSFSRVGYVSSHSAQILVREPDQLKLPTVLSYRIAPEERSSNSLKKAWLVGGTINQSQAVADYTAPMSITNLIPETRYEYRLDNNSFGSFRTAPLPGAPSNPTDVFTFLSTSCIKPRFPFHPLDHPLRIPGLEHLGRLIPQLRAQFMLFLGDFIYIDVPHRFGADAETYRREYRQVFASPSWPSAAQGLPWLSVYDDHEIANDWDQNTTGVYDAAMNPWNIYHASVNPPPVRPKSSYYSFTQGPASFFLLDTRRYRSPEFDSPPESRSKTMLGQTQLADLKEWLQTPSQPGVKWKIIISSIPFTKNWKVNAIDTWAGYLYERRLVLEAMWDAGMRGDGIVVLSGDRHEFAATRFPPPKNGRWPRDVAVHEFSTSPLSMFYLPIRTYWQSKGDEEDEAIKYLPDGNSKFSAIDIARLGVAERGRLKLRLFIDGVEAWNYTLTSPPAHL